MTTLTSVAALISTLTVAAPRPILPQRAQPATRPAVSIVAFETDRTPWVPPPQFGQTVADLLASRLIDTGAFRVFDRNLLSLNGSDQPAGRRSFDALRELARQSGVDYVVLGAVTTFGNEKSHTRGGLIGIPFLGGIGKNKQESQIGLTLRIVDVRSGEIVSSTTAAGVASKGSRTVAAGGLLRGLPIGGGFSTGGHGALDRLVSQALIDAIEIAAEALTKTATRLTVGQGRKESQGR